MFGVSEARLLIAVVVGRPAVRHQEVEDGGVVGDLWTRPADYQSAAVHVLHLHVNWSAAAHWEEEGDRKERGKGGRSVKTEETNPERGGK